MQKAIQRTAMAKRQAARKAQKVTEMDKAFDKRAARKELQQIKTATNRSIVDAKMRRREDWLLGPLAPRRDVGEWREKFATIDTRRTQLPDADPDLKKQLSPFAETDRVVILKGRDKGKIGEIREVDEDSRTVRVKDLNLVCLLRFVIRTARARGLIDSFHRPMSSSPSTCARTRAIRPPFAPSSSRSHSRTCA